MTYGHHRGELGTTIVAMNLRTAILAILIIHELTHLIEANHTPRFWNIVRTQTPTMEKARTWLKENGQILEEDV